MTANFIVRYSDGTEVHTLDFETLEEAWAEYLSQIRFMLFIEWVEILDGQGVVFLREENDRPIPGNFRTSFPNFDPATLPDIPEHWKDTSSDIDGCPTWDTGNGHTVFVKHEFYAIIESRFLVIDHTTHRSLNSSDWNDILEFVNRRDRPIRDSTASQSRRGGNRRK